MRRSGLRVGLWPCGGRDVFPETHRWPLVLASAEHRGQKRKFHSSCLPRPLSARPRVGPPQAASPWRRARVTWWPRTSHHHSRAAQVSNGRSWVLFSSNHTHNAPIYLLPFGRPLTFHLSTSRSLDLSPLVPLLFPDRWLCPVLRSHTRAPLDHPESLGALRVRNPPAFPTCALFLGAALSLFGSRFGLVFGSAPGSVSGLVLRPPKEVCVPS